MNLLDERPIPVNIPSRRAAPPPSLDRENRPCKPSSLDSLPPRFSPARRSVAPRSRNMTPTGVGTVPGFTRLATAASMAPPRWVLAIKRPGTDASVRAVASRRAIVGPASGGLNSSRSIPSTSPRRDLSTPTPYEPHPSGRLRHLSAHASAGSCALRPACASEFNWNQRIRPPGRAASSPRGASSDHPRSFTSPRLDPGAIRAFPPRPSSDLDLDRTLVPREFGR